MAVTVPGPKKKRVWEREALSAWITGLGAVPTGAAAVWKAVADGASRAVIALSATAVGFAVLGTVAKAIQAHLKDAKEHNPDGPVDLSSCLHVAHAMLGCGATLPEGRLRITVHRVIGDQLEQCVPYVGGRGGTAGRKFSVRSGVIGAVVRTKDAVKAKRVSADHADFVLEMKKEWSMTDDEARALDAGRNAYLGVPLFGLSEDVIGVMFLDSDKAEFFDDATVNLAVAAARGLAEYIKKHYV